MSSMSEPGPSAGALLRAAREQRGMHIAALAAAIKVAPRKLDALENDRWDELPDATFVRALAQTVCRTLKIDAAPVLGLLPAAGSPSLGAASGGLNAPFHDRARRDPSGLAVSAIGPMVWAGGALMLAAMLIYFLPSSLWLSKPAEKPATHAPDAGTPSNATATASAASTAASTVDGVAYGPAAGGAALSSAAEAGSGPTAVPGGQFAGGEAAASAAVTGNVASGREPAGSAGPAPNDAAAVAAAAPGSAPAALGKPVAASQALRALASTSRTSPLPVPVPMATAANAPAPASAPLARAQTAAPGGLVQIRPSQATWVEVRDADRQLLLSRTLQAGENVGLDGRLPLHAVIGNAAATALSFRGHVVDLLPSTRDNVARLDLPPAAASEAAPAPPPASSAQPR